MANRYDKIISHVFFQRYRDGDRVVKFARDDLGEACVQLSITMPKNLGERYNRISLMAS